MRHVRSRGENIWSGQRIDGSEKILFKVNAHPIPESKAHCGGNMSLGLGKINTEQVM